MHFFRTINTNTLAPQLYHTMMTHGVSSPSRNGPVLRLPGPTICVIEAPEQRVHFCPVRNANPFFHLFEAMAMITNNNDAAFLGWFAKQMLSYVDEGQSGFNAFYGTRMHRQGQFNKAVQSLIDDPASRRAYVDLWDIADTSKVTKDMACNLGMLFEIVDGKLDMTTFNRSNDAIWGYVTGANIVHFSFFQELAALTIGIPIGKWTHISANMHVYTENPQWSKLIQEYETRNWLNPWDYTSTRDEIPIFRQPMFESGPGRAAEFADQLATFVYLAIGVQRQPSTLQDFMSIKHTSTFISRVLKPMLTAWALHKNGFPLDAILEQLHAMPAGNDWRAAGLEWVHRNHKQR